MSYPIALQGYDSLSVQKGVDSFLIDRLVYRVQGSLIGSEAVVPYMRSASLIDHFQHPVDLIVNGQVN